MLKDQKLEETLTKQGKFEYFEVGVNVVNLLLITSEKKTLHSNLKLVKVTFKGKCKFLKRL